jgi:hypothetical protein
MDGKMTCLIELQKGFFYFSGLTASRFYLVYKSPLPHGANQTGLIKTF